MSAGAGPGRGTNTALIGGGVLMVLCCAIGPAVIGAVAGSAIGGWLGLACAVLLAGLVGLVLRRRTTSEGGC